MLRVFKPALIVLGFAAIFSACEKEYSTENGNDPGTGVIGGCKSCTYQPWCDGSTYTYIDTSGGTASTRNGNIDIIGDTTIDGRVYSVTLTNGNRSYHNCTNGVTTVIAYESTTPGAPPEKLVNTFLQENAAVGATWSDVNPTGTGQNIIFEYEIISKGGSRTVLGVTYNDVIHVKQISSIEVPIFGLLETSNADYYYARDIGLIESEIFDSLIGSQLLHSVLQSYNIP